MSEYEDRSIRMPNKKTFDSIDEAICDFELNAMKNKKQVVDRIKKYIDKINSNEMLETLSIFKRNIIACSLKRLLRDITYRLFPDLSKQDGRWSYTIYIFEGKIQIRYQVIGFSSCYNEWMIEQYDTFHECETVLYSVGEYSKHHNVAETTVREWIRRGKIDSAVKKGLEWFIPAMTEPLDRSSASIHFERITYDDILDDLSILNQDARFIDIRKSKGKGEFDFILRDDYCMLIKNEKIDKALMMKIRRRLLESYDFKASINDLIFAENY